MRTIVSLAALLLAVSCNRNPATTEPVGGSSANGGDPPPSGAPSGPRTQPLVGPHVVLRPAGHEPVTVRVEVALTEEQQQRGLMFRRELAENAGMIFLFRRQHHLAFWMHNTFLPLDMIFITSERRVLGVVANATPMTDDSREVPGDSQFVLEVRAGFAARHHITPGTPVEFVNVPSPLPPRPGDELE